MKKWIALLLAAACLLTLCACNKDEDSAEESLVTVYLPSEETLMEINRVYSYSYDERGYKTSCVIKTDGKVDSHIDYTYDDQGNKISQLQIVDGEESSRINYTYDQKGNHIETRSYYKGKFNSSHSYTYDQNGKLIEEVRCSDGRTTHLYTYTYENNTVTEFYYTSDGTLELTSIFVRTLDQQGHILQTSSYALEDKDRLDQADPLWTYTFVYDGDLLVEEAHYFDGTMTLQKTYKYNQQGDPIEYICKSYDNGEVINQEVLTYDYTYDAHGNLIKQERYMNGQADSSETWTYTYVAVTMSRQLAEKLGYL